MSSSAVASDPRTVSPGRTRASVPASAPLMTRIKRIGKHGEPRQAMSLPGLLFSSRAYNPQAYPPIRSPFSLPLGNPGLEQRRGSCIVVSCFETRKRIEAWNPGSFGCRGLLLCAAEVRAAGPSILLFSSNGWNRSVVGTFPFPCSSNGVWKHRRVTPAVLPSGLFKGPPHPRPSAPASATDPAADICCRSRS